MLVFVYLTDDGQRSLSKYIIIVYFKFWSINKNICVANKIVWTITIHTTVFITSICIAVSEVIQKILSLMFTSNKVQIKNDLDYKSKHWRSSELSN